MEPLEFLHEDVLRELPPTSEERELERLCDLTREQGWASLIDWKKTCILGGTLCIYPKDEKTVMYVAMLPQKLNVFFLSEQVGKKPIQTNRKGFGDIDWILMKIQTLLMGNE